MAAWKNESQDAIRVSALTASIAITQKLDATENQTKMLHIIQAAANDRSWRIRLRLAELFDQVRNCIM